MPIVSRVFSEGAINDKPLKNKDLLRESFIYNELSYMSKKDLAEFKKSPAAKYLVENDILSYSTLDRLVSDNFGDKGIEFFCCHMAKENGDDRWDELVRHREEERRIMDELIDSYGNEAKANADTYREQYLNHNLPKEYRVNDEAAAAVRGTMMALNAKSSINKAKELLKNKEEDQDEKE